MLCSPVYWRYSAMASVVYILLALVAVASAAPESRVVGGTPVTIEEFPYAASFMYTYPGPGITIQRCVGCIISSFHVLTSGFCYTGAVLTNMQVRAGSTNSLSGGIVVNVRTFEKYPGYAEIPREGDLAVTFLASPLGIGPTINALFLPPQNMYIADGQSVKVVSWGFESPTGPQIEILKTVFFNKLSLADCQTKHAENADSVSIVDAVICGQAPGKAICLGDSGAPMVINNVVVGTSSYFESCDDEYPVVFTRVDRYTNWILEVAAAGKSERSTADNIIPAPVVQNV